MKRGAWAAIALVAGCAPVPDAILARTSSAPIPSPRPAECREVAAGAPLQPLLVAAKEGDALCLAPGDYHGPLAITGAVTLWGPRDAVIHSTGEGTTVRVDGAARLYGFTIDGSGGRYDLLDAALHVTGEGAVVWGIAVEHAVYGILVERAKRVTVRDNLLRGDAEVTMSLRGDAIRLWDAQESVVERNDVVDGRDIVVWYSRGAIVRGNTVRHARYGTHFMYSEDSLAEGNLFEGVAVGVFVMYSHRVTLRGNVVMHAAGAAGMGIGLKDSGDVVLDGNRVLHASTGLYLDKSPSRLGETVHVEGNQFRMCNAAVLFHASEQRIRFLGNVFADNRVHVSFAGGVDNSGVVWAGNYFDDYIGYDLDGDGAGDVPYESFALSGALFDKYPSLAFFEGAPAMAMTDAVTRLVPLFRPTPLVTDARPAMSIPSPSQVPRAH